MLQRAHDFAVVVQRQRVHVEQIRAGEFPGNAADGNGMEGAAAPQQGGGREPFQQTDVSDLAASLTLMAPRRGRNSKL